MILEGKSHHLYSMGSGNGSERPEVLDKSKVSGARFH